MISPKMTIAIVDPMTATMPKVNQIVIKYFVRGLIESAFWT